MELRWEVCSRLCFAMAVFFNESRGRGLFIQNEELRRCKYNSKLALNFICISIP